MKKKKRFTAVDILYFLGALLISAGVGIGLGLSAGLGASGLFCLVASWLSDDSRQKKGGKE